jgi:rhamnogalacturonan endolyase
MKMRGKNATKLSPRVESLERRELLSLARVALSAPNSDGRGRIGAVPCELVKEFPMSSFRATFSRFLCRLATLCCLAAWCLPCGAADLFRDDFSRFPPGWLTRPVGRLNAAIQEYHYLANRGVPLGPWANAICHLDAWAVGEEGGKAYLEQHTVNDQPRLMNPIFLTGDPEWENYTVEAGVRPLSLDDMSGIVFRYHTNRHYYVFALTGGNRARLALRLPLETTFRVADWRELGSADFPYDSQRYYRLRVENDGSKIRALIDDKLILTAVDGELIKGKAGVTANIPARFQDFHVTAPDDVRSLIDARVASREAELVRLRRQSPLPKVWKTFKTPKFGAGRNVRFGDLDGDGTPEMLISQNIPRIGDNFIQISCMTAVTLDERVLWQLGRPDPRNGLLTADTPFQIHDIDGDGLNEVVMVKDFKLQVLEGRTGPEVGMDAARSTRQWQEAVRADQRRRAVLPQLFRADGPARVRGQGPLYPLLDVRRRPEPVVAGTGTDRSFPLSLRP